nr:hypothetical protein RKE32_17260 [Streptomyces sp. Li-HN-5-13]
MPPRKRAPAATSLPHEDGCTPDRVETFAVLCPDGETRTVVRCLECGAQLVK